MRKILLLVFCISFVFSANAQLSIGDTNTDYTINFDSTVSGVNNGSYDGTGFATTPATGDLDGNAWAVSGFSGANQSFDGTSNSNDMARGLSAGDVGTGGIYSFQVGGASDVAFGVQPGGSDFTPGAVTLKITNNTGSTVTRFEIDYEVWQYNDQEMSSSLNFSYSSDNSSYTSVASLNYTTTGAAAGSPSWSSTAKNATVYGLSIADGASFYIRWTGDDASGSGARDEIAIDDIVVKVNGPVSTTQNGDWDLDATWESGSVPASTDDVIIAHNNDVDDTRSCNSITISAGGRLDVEAALTVATSSSVGSGAVLNIKSGGTYTQSAGSFTNSGGTITVFAGQDMVFSSNSTTLTNTGVIEINSSSSLFGSLILSGSYSESGVGVINYRRYVASTSTWDLIGPPLSGYDMEDFIDENTDIATGNGSGAGASGEYAVGYYTNTAAAYNAGNAWVNYTSSTYDSAGNLEPGKGYQMATSGGSEIKFTGNVETGNVTETIVNNEGGTTNQNDGTKWNLVSNPYPSYITVSNFLSQNSSVLHASHQTVWGWGGSSYTAYNSASGAFIAPGQGFMVGAIGPEGTSSTLTFTTAMQTTSGSDDFISGDAMDDNRAELFVNMNQNGTDRHTELYFLDNMTDGLDPSYDSGTLELANNSIYSRLVDNSLETNFIIQSLSFDEMWDKVIPLGINALGGEEMTISISHRTTPADLNIYLEDTEEGTMTNLLDGDYVLTPASDLSGVGRFFIHMTADTMSNGEVSTSMLNAYKETDASYITIEGLATQSNETKVSLYNILGREVLSTTLNNNMGTQTISTVGLSAGIYVIELESGSDRLTKKLLIQ